MIRVEQRGKRYFVVEGLREFMAALAVPEKTTAICREQACADAESIATGVFSGTAWVCEVETWLDDGTRVTGEYIIDELPAFLALDVRPPEAPIEDQKRIADEYHAIPPIIPAQD